MNDILNWAWTYRQQSCAISPVTVPQLSIRATVEKTLQTLTAWDLAFRSRTETDCQLRRALRRMS